MRSMAMTALALVLLTGAAEGQRSWKPQAEAGVPLPVAKLGPAVHDVLPPPSWAPQDPADSLWRAAREALDRRDNARAATLYAEIRTTARLASSAFRAPSYYWEAFARQRIGTQGQLQAAREVLEQLRRDHPRYEGMADAERLRASIDAQLAALGNADAARRLATSVQAAAAGRPNFAPRTPAQQECDATQLAAVEALSYMPAEQSLPLLRRVMERRDCDRMRETALFILARTRTPEAEETILRAVQSDPSPRVRESAVAFLAGLNTDRSRSALEGILRTSSDPRMLEVATMAMAQRSDTAAARLLRALATRDGAPLEARTSAIMLLGRTSDPTNAPFLRSLYEQSSDERMKEAVLHALATRRPLAPLNAWASSFSPAVAPRAAEAAAAAARTATPPRTAGTPQPPASPAPVTAVQGRAEPAVDDVTAEWLLRIALNGRESMNLRRQALFLAAQNRVVSLQRLTEMYRAVPDRQMKEHIMASIMRSTEPDAVARMIEIVRSEQDQQLKQAGIYWLGRSRDPRAAQFIAELIGG